MVIKNALVNYIKALLVYSKNLGRTLLKFIFKILFFLKIQEGEDF